MTPAQSKRLQKILAQMPPIEKLDPAMYAKLQSTIHDAVAKALPEYQQWVGKNIASDGQDCPTPVCSSCGNDCPTPRCSSCGNDCPTPLCSSCGNDCPTPTATRNIEADGHFGCQPGNDQGNSSSFGKTIQIRSYFPIQKRKRSNEEQATKIVY